MTAIIIDDEAKSRLALRQKLADYCPQVSVIAEADNGQDGINLIEVHKPTIVFLDIEMPYMTGFEMLQEIKDKNFQVIFTTAYDQYAIKAIKFSAFDYLLKPVDIEELKTSVNKIAEKENIQTIQQIESLQQNILQPKKQLHKLAIPTFEGLLFCNINDVIRLESNRNYTNILVQNGQKILASKTLKEFEDILPEELFFRVHHSHLINLECIKKYIKSDGGQLEMINGDIIEISRRKKEEFLKLFEG